MAITASVQPVSGRIVYMQNPTSRIRFSSVFQRRPGSYCAKPARIRSGWLCQVWAKCIRSGSKPVSRNHRASFLAGRNRPGTSFPLSDSVAFVHRQAWIILCKTSPDPTGLWPTVSCFWPNGSNPKASRCGRLIGPASLPSLQKLWTQSCDFVPHS